MIAGQWTFKDTDSAFDKAVVAGLLSYNPDSPRYVGLYMYLGTLCGRNTFKCIKTRAWLLAEAAS